MAMKWNQRHPSLLFSLVLLSLLGLAVFACTSDSPSEPRQDPNPPPGGGGGEFNVTVTATPGEVLAGSENPVEVVVRVRSRTTGAPPANGSTAVVSASLGGFNAPDGPSSGPITLFNGEARFQFFAGPNPGTAVIQVEFRGDVGQALVTLRDLAAFFLSFVDPDRGQGGDAVTIHGGGFVRPLRVTFNGVSARVLGVAPNRIRVEVPPAPGPVDSNSTLPVGVSVTIALDQQGEATDSLSNGFSYLPGGTSQPQPVVFSVEPPSGPNEGGTRVNVLGDNFQAPVRVLFGDVEATVEAVTKTRITARTPAATALGVDNRGQTVDVRVINVDSGFEDTLNNGFTYGDVAFFIRAIAPSSGPQAGGTQVTLTGTGFLDPLRVTFGDFVATVVSVSSTEVILRTPAITDDVLNTETCNDNSDEQEGERFLPTAFDVTATNVQFGDTDTLDNAFIYTPTDSTCRNDVAPPPPPPPPPTAAFTFNANALTVIFTNNSSDFQGSLWDFGDGMTSTERDPVHTYAAPGTYTVTLTVSNLIGQTDSVSQFVTVPPP